MKKQLLVYCIFAFLCLSSPAQDTIEHRIILIGDAGEINPGQTSIIQLASGLVLPGKTTTVFLGDNIYPTGIGLPGNWNEEKTKQILIKQFRPFRTKHASVYFIPGNHDWDKSGRHGLEKVQAQWKFIHDQADDSLSFLPVNGCPDPVAAEVSTGLMMIAIDSEWWLNPKDNNNPGCHCKNKEEVIRKLTALRDHYRDKIILVATHHPFRSYGIHGSYYTLKDHLFPLTGIREYLYIPLPLIGSLYPLLRTIFVNKQDLKHPDYQDMVARVSEVFQQMPNVIFASGHEHGLQLIKDSILQVVSGAGSRTTAVKSGKHSLFKSSSPGFAVLNLYKNKSPRLDFYNLKNNNRVHTFSYEVSNTNGKTGQLLQNENNH